MEEKAVNFTNNGFKQEPFFVRTKIWLNVLLFVVTIISTFSVGITWSISYKYADVISQNSELSIDLVDSIKDPQIISMSMVYAVVLLSILLCHEFGHFLTCRYYRINATLPYFIPAPTLIGTMGAFIKIKSPITRKRQLFDIGAAGPLAGFVLAVPTLIYGLSLSKVVPSIPHEGSIVFGEPLLLKIIGNIIFKGISENFDLILHPIAFAGWVGILVTALNLFPVGQLDGGHISYAIFGQRTRRFVPLILVAFIVMGIFFWVGWLVWALLISFLGLKHPRIADEKVPLSSGRKFVGFLILLIFIFSFIPDPIKGYNLFDVIKQFSF